MYSVNQSCPEQAYSEYLPLEHTLNQSHPFEYLYPLNEFQSYQLSQLNQLDDKEIYRRLINHRTSISNKLMFYFPFVSKLFNNRILSNDQVKELNLLLMSGPGILKSSELLLDMIINSEVLEAGRIFLQLLLEGDYYSFQHIVYHIIINKF